MDSKFSNKYNIVKQINENKSNINSSLYLVNLKKLLVMKKIETNNFEDKTLIYNIMQRMKEEIKIYDIIEENEIIYIIFENKEEYKTKIENILENKILKEGMLKSHSRPLNKKEIDELYNNESSMCKISFVYEKNGIPRTGTGTGFFCEIKEKDIPFKKALFTNNHILNKENIEIGKYITFEYLNKRKQIEIKEERRVFTNEKYDFTCIEIFDEDEIKNFFKIYPNISKNKNILSNAEIFILQYPFGGELSFSSGKVISIRENTIKHSASTNEGSSGSPIINRDDNFIFGLHYGCNYMYTIYNVALLFDKILEIIKLQFNNMIIANITINKDNFETKIINSYENAKKGNNYLKNFIAINNEKEVKDCDIYINEIKIDFNYTYIFPKKGNYTIKYIFHNLLSSTNFMFYDCNSLESLDFSNFNTEKVINMSYMFCKCTNLKSLNVSNFNNQKVTNMYRMFCECESLINLNLSNFNTQNVSNMGLMFCDCNSLKNLNLSNFNTQNVTNMGCMFGECKELKNLNLSNFKTQNVINMENMFYYCSSLTSLDLSNFNTQNVINMSFMFTECNSLISLNLSNFNTDNVTDMKAMFSGCNKLVNIDLSNFNTQKVKSIEWMFNDCNSLKKCKSIKF